MDKDRPVKVQLMPLFPTWIYICESGPSHLNGQLEDLAHQLMLDERNAVQRTNAGGWHYAFDLFERTEPAIAEFRSHMEAHTRAFLKQLQPTGGKENSFRLRGWMNVNRAGDKNILHCHPGSFFSATYYVKVPADMKGGEIVFRDPRGPAVAMYETPGIELPWVTSGGAGAPFSPKTGMLLIFPAWLEHRVEPFEGSDERISIAFNASNS
jgi:uncharacterized protein (TIGR02466 family)